MTLLSQDRNRGVQLLDDLRRFEMTLAVVENNTRDRLDRNTSMNTRRYVPLKPEVAAYG